VRAPSNKEVAEKSEAVRARYTRMPYMEAKLAFAYELQGYIKSMVTDHDQDMDGVLALIAELLVMVRDAQNNNQRVSRK
jgi:hypothetical protein